MMLALMNSIGSGQHRSAKLPISAIPLTPIFGQSLRIVGHPKGRRSLPATARPLWILTAFLIAAFPVLSLVYWPQVLRSGQLPSDGDSIGIPMYGSVLIAIIASPFVIGIAGLCLRRYNRPVRLTAYRHDRPLRSALATILFGGAGVVLMLGSIAELMHQLPWYEYLWPVYTAFWVPWLFGLRAAFIEQNTIVIG